MLHIMTPAFRFGKLEKVYSSIPAHEDIKWHISKSNKRKDIDFGFIKDDSRIVLHNVDCEDHEIHKKRNEVFDKIKDGYFCLLDDDTILHENMYLKYKECEEQNFVGMVVGQQLDNRDRVRLIAIKPEHCKIDTGNVLAHTACLKECRWPNTSIVKDPCRDFFFWESVCNYFNKECTVWDAPISYYNKLV